MAKEKVHLDNVDPDRVLRHMAERYSDEQLNDTDGIKIDFEDGWVHMRKSNTEPIIRIYTEAKTSEEARKLAGRFIREISGL